MIRWDGGGGALSRYITFINIRNVVWGPIGERRGFFQAYDLPIELAWKSNTTLVVSVTEPSDAKVFFAETQVEQITIVYENLPPVID